MEYPDLSNIMYLSRLTMMFISCFSHLLCGRFGLGLGSNLELGIGLVLGDKVKTGSGLMLGLSQS